jgi:hypothetical protein
MLISDDLQTNLGGGLTYDNTANKYKINLPATTTFVGSYDVKQTGTYKGMTKNFYKKVVVVPDMSAYLPSAANHSLATCQIKIYPMWFQYTTASNHHMQLHRAILDQYGNHILCGYS